MGIYRNAREGERLGQGVQGGRAGQAVQNNKRLLMNVCLHRNAKIMQKEKRTEEGKKNKNYSQHIWAKKQNAGQGSESGRGKWAGAVDKFE